MAFWRRARDEAVDVVALQQNAPVVYGLDPGAFAPYMAGPLRPGAFAPYMAGPLRDAHRRARELLLRLLSPEQRCQLRVFAGFTERGADGRTYLFNGGGVVLADAETGAVTEHWCVQIPDPSVPYEDAVIARLLHLRSDPAALRRMAKASPLR